MLNRSTSDCAVLNDSELKDGFESDDIGLPPPDHLTNDDLGIHEDPLPGLQNAIMDHDDNEHRPVPGAWRNDAQVLADMT